MRPSPRYVLAILCALVTVAAPAARAQSDLPPITRTVAFTGATVVTAPGAVTENATVVLRDGVITAVGIGVPIPYDARVVPADSMFIYAGFVDALSHAGQSAPRPQRPGSGVQQTPVPDRGNPPNDRAGIQPERDVRTMLDPADDSVEKMRSAGFTAAHTVPYGRMLPGQGAVVLLHGETAADMVVSGNASVFAQFVSAQGMYPGTPMAMTAKMRQLYREGERRLAISKQYEADPSGMSRPDYDPAHAALFPVIEGDLPIFFHVDDALEAHRALTLREDLGFRMVLTGLSQGYDLADKIVRSGVPIAVTTDFPSKPGWMATLKRDSLETVMASYDPELRTATWRDVEAEIRTLEARQALARHDYVRNAASLASAGAEFAFTSMDTDPGDVLPNIREMLAAGLDTSAALAGLTTAAADLIGQSRTMGSISVGKLGNLVLTDGPLFDEDTNIRHVVIEGTIYDIEQPDQRRGGRGDGEGIAGTWEIMAMTPEGAITGSMEISGSGDDLSGTIQYEGSPEAISLSDISVRGNRVTINFSSPDGEISLRLRRSGSEMSGEALLDGTEAIPVSMERKPSN